MAYGSSQTRRLLSSLALAALLAGATAGCKTTGAEDFTGSIGAQGAPRSEREVADAWAERYRAKPGDAEVAMGYAQVLRRLDQRAQAVAVLEQATIANPKNTTLLGVYGRALADAGRHDQALDVLSRAHTPDQPDWRLLSVMGAVLDQLGRHQDAQRHYTAALKIMPDEPTVLSNLGLSYALAKNLPRAETVLRRAAAKPPVDSRVRQNLALVVGLRGRFSEAEAIARANLPPDEAAANVAYLREMLAQKDGLERFRPGRNAAQAVQEPRGGEPPRAQRETRGGRNGA